MIQVIADSLSLGSVYVLFALGLSLSWSVLNLLNLFDKNSGEVYYAAFNDILAVRYAGVNAATGKYVYDISPLKASTFGNGFTRDDLRSRWQAQWGLRVRF